MTAVSGALVGTEAEVVVECASTAAEQAARGSVRCLANSAADPCLASSWRERSSARVFEKLQRSHYYWKSLELLYEDSIAFVVRPKDCSLRLKARYSLETQVQRRTQEAE